MGLDSTLKHIRLFVGSDCEVFYMNVFIYITNEPHLSKYTKRNKINLSYSTKGQCSHV